MAIVRGAWSELLRPGLMVDYIAQTKSPGSGLYGIDNGELVYMDRHGRLFTISNFCWSHHCHIYIPTHRDQLVKWEDEDKYDVNGNLLPQSHIIKPEGLILPPRKKLWTGVDLYNKQHGPWHPDKEFTLGFDVSRQMIEDDMYVSVYLPTGTYKIDDPLYPGKILYTTDLGTVKPGSWVSYFAKFGSELQQHYTNILLDDITNEE